MSSHILPCFHFVKILNRKCTVGFVCAGCTLPSLSAGAIVGFHFGPRTKCDPKSSCRLRINVLIYNISMTFIHGDPRNLLHAALNLYWETTWTSKRNIFLGANCVSQYSQSGWNTLRQHHLHVKLVVFLAFFSNSCTSSQQRRPMVWKMPDFTYSTDTSFLHYVAIRPGAAFRLDKTLMIPKGSLKREQDVANNKTIVCQK